MVTLRHGLRYAFAEHLLVPVVDLMNSRHDGAWRLIGVRMSCFQVLNTRG